jgi:hypothetical protein
VGGNELLDDPAEEGRFGLFGGSGGDAGSEEIESSAILTRLGSVLNACAGGPLLMGEFVTRQA